MANHGNDTVSSLEGFFDWRHTTLPSEGHRPSGVAVDPERCRMYVTNAASDSVTVFNTCSSVRIDTIEFGEARAPGGIAVFAPANAVYVSNSAAGSVSVIDGDALAVGLEIPVGPRPGQLAVNPVTDRVYVALRGNVPASIGAVAVIDARTQSVRETIDLSATDPLAEPHGLAVNHITNLVYVALAGGQLVTIDGQANRVVGALSPPHAAGLGAVAVNATTNHIFVSSTADNEVFVFDADVGAWFSTLPVGEGWPRGIGVNPLTLQVIVSNPYANTVTLTRDHGAYQPFRRFLPIISGP